MVPPPLFFSHCTLNPPDKLTDLGENHPKEKNTSVFSQLQLSELTNATASMLAGNRREDLLSFSNSDPREVGALKPLGLVLKVRQMKPTILYSPLANCSIWVK